MPFLLKFLWQQTALFLLFCWSAGIRNFEASLPLPKAFEVHYNLTRMLVSDQGVTKKQIVTNGIFYGTDSFSITKNERLLYLREKANCLIIFRKYGNVMQIDSSNASSYLSGEPANDLFLLMKLTSELSSSSETINDNEITKRYFTGNIGRSLDSVYLTFGIGKNFPDRILYVSKRGKGQRSIVRIIDSLQITQLDTLPVKPKSVGIDAYLKSDAPTRRKMLHDAH